MRHKYYGQIIFCGPSKGTNSDLVARLEKGLESGGFRKIATGEPGPKADPIGLILDGKVPITVAYSNLQSYFDGDGDVARLTYGRVDGTELNYLELEMLPGDPMLGVLEEKLEGLPLALELRGDILKELRNQRTQGTPQ